LKNNIYSFVFCLRWLSRFTTGGWICVPSGAPCVSDETQRLNFFHTFIAEHLPLKPKWRLQIQSGRTVLQIGKIKGNLQQEFWWDTNKCSKNYEM
jgi:hypothetical protein